MGSRGYRIAYVALIMLVLLTLQGCFGKSGDAFDWTLLDGVERDPLVIFRVASSAEIEREPSPFSGETLTIGISDSVTNDLSWGYGYDWRSLTNSFKWMHYGVEVNIVVYDDDVGIQRLQVELMAGTGPDLFQGSIVNFPYLANAQVFADWQPLMDLRPAFDEADWNMSIFDLIKQEFGRIVGFPAALNYTHVLVNRKHPGSG